LATIIEVVDENYECKTLIKISKTLADSLSLEV